MAQPRSYLFVPADRQESVKQALHNLIHVPFRFEPSGSQIIFYEPGVDYQEAEKTRMQGSLSKPALAHAV